MSYQQQLNDAAKRCHVGSYAVGANRICAEADATIAAKDAEIASLRDRLRDTAQILIAEVGATGPADAEEVARKAVSQIARLREALLGASCQVTDFWSKTLSDGNRRLQQMLLNLDPDRFSDEELQK